MWTKGLILNLIRDLILNNVKKTSPDALVNSHHQVMLRTTKLGLEMRVSPIPTNQNMIFPIKLTMEVG